MDENNLLAPFEIAEVRKAMNDNKVAISKIFVKYKFGSLPVNQFTAGLAYKQLGMKEPAQASQFARELSDFIIPPSYNNAAGDVGDTAITDTNEAGDKQENRIDWANQVLGWTGQAVDIATDIAGTVAVKKALENATPGTTVTTTGLSTTKTANETASEKKILGLSYMQAALAAAVVLALIVLVYFGTRKKSAAA